MPSCYSELLVLAIHSSKKEKTLSLASLMLGTKLEFEVAK